MSDVTITISKNGPLLVKQPVKVIDQATGDELAIDKFPIALCRCGQSASKPFCDGTHSKVGFDGTLNLEK
ncbi:MAG: CDGSH iron-sulfur domain-containing protein [Proteobacteria bacterium]|nr:CDGSH iron-sulfur domain-containing protein [Pseudomonadota bacterium]